MDITAYNNVKSKKIKRAKREKLALFCEK